MYYEFTHVTCKNAGKDIVSHRSQRCILPVAGAFCFEDLGFQTRPHRHGLFVKSNRSWNPPKERILMRSKHPDISA